jgi:hypothetical protein
VADLVSANSFSNVPNQSYLCAPALLDIVRAVKWCMGCAMEFMMQFLVVLCVVLAVLWVREA